MRRQKIIGPISLVVTLILVSLAVVACSDPQGKAPRVVTDTSVPEDITAPTIAPAPTAKPTTKPAPTDVPTKIAIPTSEPIAEPTNTPVPTPEPTFASTEAPTATPEATDTPIRQTIISEYGFHLQLDGDVSVQTGGWLEESPTNEQGMIRFPYQGVTAILTWNASTVSPQQAVADSYKLLRDGQPNLTFEPIKDGGFRVSGEQGVFGGFKVLDATDTTVGGGFVAAWTCSEAQLQYSLTVTGSQLTTVQIRFQRIVVNFSCPS